MFLDAISVQTLFCNYIFSLNGLKLQKTTLLGHFPVFYEIHHPIQVNEPNF